MTDYSVKDFLPGFAEADTVTFNCDIVFAGTVDLAGAMTDGLVISGACSDNGIEISGICTGAVMQVTGVNTGSILDITGVWGQGFTQAALNIGGAAAIAFGSCADQLVLARYNITAQVGTAEGYVIGEYKNYATSGAGPGTVLQHGIWMGDYTGLTISHNTTDAYANRGRCAIDGTIAGNQFIGVMGQMSITGAATLEDTGGAYGIYSDVTSSGSGACNRNVAAGYFSMRPNLIDLAGETSCVIADMGGAGYADYGFKAQVGNNHVGEAAIGVVVTDGSILPSAIKFHIDGGNSITHAFEFDAANTAASASSGTTPAGDGIIIAVDYNGTTLYLRAVSAWT